MTRTSGPTTFFSPRRLSRATTALALGCGAAMALGLARAAQDEATAPVLKTRLTSVSLFKNGLGFVTREAVLPKGQGPWVIEGLPAPVNGTFWAYPVDRRVTVKDMVAFSRDTVEKVEAISVAELLAANVGQTVDLRMGEKETMRGKILVVPPERVFEPTASDPRSAMNYYPAGPQVEPASLVLVQTGDGTTAVSKGAVTQITNPTGALKGTFERKRRGAALRLRASGSDGADRIVVQYLARGLTWAPSCAIDITDPQKARLTAKATIIDEIEDLDETPVSFVTGYPNLQFADVADPMAMAGNLASYINMLMNPAATDFRVGRGVITQNATIDAVSSVNPLFPDYSTTPQAGQAREELFFYEPRGVTLKKGERGYYPLFTVDVPYEHVYEWKIGDTIDQQDRYQSRPPDAPERTEDVWHSVRLTNAGTVPWTTAPAMTMQDGQILGQDTLHYTSVGGKTNVRITKAVDLKAEQSESEVDRKRSAATFYGNIYDLVEVRGTLRAANYKDKSLTLTIGKDVSGEVIESAPTARVEQTARGLRKVNPKSVLSWELPIGPRGKIEITYSYRVYVRD